MTFADTGQPVKSEKRPKDSKDNNINEHENRFFLTHENSYLASLPLCNLYL